VAPGKPLRIANSIYREVIARVFSSAAEDRVTDEPERFVLPDGRLAWKRLLRAFATFWSEHGEVLAAGMPYSEAAPQLVVMAFLQRIVNGGGFIDREYGVGRGRIDLLVRFPYRRTSGEAAMQRRAMELNVWRKGQQDPLAKGLAQIDAYLAAAPPPRNAGDLRRPRPARPSSVALRRDDDALGPPRHRAARVTGRR
jgi:hypothetical protein